MKITEGREMMEILNDFKTFISRIGIIPGHINNFFPAFRDVQFYESFFFVKNCFKRGYIFAQLFLPTKFSYGGRRLYSYNEDDFFIFI